MLDWPTLVPGGPVPAWDGEAFVVGGRRTAVLRYHEHESGWSDGLTTLHEESAGRDHYIDRASRASALRALAPALARARPVILEVGCSSGYLLEDLTRRAAHAFAVGSDYLAGPLERLAGWLRGVPLVQFDLTAAPFRAGTFDGVVALNVLEHIADHERALAEIGRLLKPGGVAVLEVPAGPGLYDFYDAHLRHHRRYRLSDLRRQAEAAGLRVERGSHLGFLLYPLFAAAKKLNRWRGARLTPAQRQARVGGQIRMARSSRLLNAVMGLELALGRWVSYPWGIRCLLTARKPAAA
jgi:SAM-dependent methyltransferase